MGWRRGRARGQRRGRARGRRRGRRFVAGGPDMLRVRDGLGRKDAVGWWCLSGRRVAGGRRRWLGWVDSRREGCVLRVSVRVPGGPDTCPGRACVLLSKVPLLLLHAGCPCSAVQSHRSQDKRHLTPTQRLGQRDVRLFFDVEFRVFGLLLLCSKNLGLALALARFGHRLFGLPV